MVTDHTESIIQISQGVNKSWVTFLHQVIQNHQWLHLILPSSLCGLIPPRGISNLSHKCFELTELCQQRFMSQIREIFDVVVDFISALRRLVGHSWIDSFQNTKTSREELEKEEQGRGGREPDLKSLRLIWSFFKA